MGWGWMCMGQGGICLGETGWGWGWGMGHDLPKCNSYATGHISAPRCPNHPTPPYLSALPLHLPTLHLISLNLAQSRSTPLDPARPRSIPRPSPPFRFESWPGANLAEFSRQPCSVLLRSEASRQQQVEPDRLSGDRPALIEENSTCMFGSSRGRRRSRVRQLASSRMATDYTSQVGNSTGYPPHMGIPQATHPIWEFHRLPTPYGNSTGYPSHMGIPQATHPIWEFHGLPIPYGYSTDYHPIYWWGQRGSW